MSKLGKEGHRCHYRIDLNEENDKIVNSCPLPLSKGKRKRGEGRRLAQEAWISFF